MFDNKKFEKEQKRKWDLSVELSKYASMEGSEIGNACELLNSLFNYEDYISPEFYKSLEKEINKQINTFKTCYVIEKTIIEQKSIEYNELIYVGCPDEVY